MGYFSETDIENQENDNETFTAPATRSGIISTKLANVRRQPRKNGEVLGQLPKGTKVTIEDHVGDYMRITYRNYPEAYVADHLIEETSV